MKPLKGNRIEVCVFGDTLLCTTVELGKVNNPPASLPPSVLGQATITDNDQCSRMASGYFGQCCAAVTCAFPSLFCALYYFFNL